MSRPPDRRAAVARILASLDEVEVEVEKLVTGGEGFARYEGVPLFVPRSAPGDRARVRIVERRPDYGRAEIVELLEPGAGRREAPCPHFDRCGGCDLQHIDDDLQAKLKVAATLETLRRIGGVELDAVRLVRGADWHYRLRTQLRTDGGPAVGYHARGSHDLVPISSCAVLAPELERAALTLDDEAGTELPRRVDLTLGEDGRVAVAPPLETYAGGAITRTVAGHRLELDARTFFQSHAGLLEDLAREVVGRWRGGTVLDLYAGVGPFSLPLSERYERVVAVESDRVAARYARRNARRAPGSIDVEGRSVEGFLASWRGSVDRVVVDPPRSGLGRPVKRELLRIAAPRMTYASCQPATLARDLRDLLLTYEIESMCLLDMFPQTGHIEAVAHLRWKDR